ncbi:MAG: hypothetical protein R3C45_03940 [Phycisphaerales bacterium]
MLKLQILPHGKRFRDVPAGFFGFEKRKAQLDAHGNPLRVIEKVVDFEMFRPTLVRVRDRNRKPNAERPAYDVVK